jgi:hypothetical protein
MIYGSSFFVRELCGVDNLSFIEEECARCEQIIHYIYFFN